MRAECDRAGRAWSDMEAARGSSTVSGTSGVDGGMWTKRSEAQERTRTKEVPRSGGERVGVASRAFLLVDVDGVGYHFFGSANQRALTTRLPPGTA